MNISHIKRNGCIYMLLLGSLFCGLQKIEASDIRSGDDSAQLVFFYKKNNILLLPTYRDNDLRLRELDRMVAQYKAANGAYYFSIISYVSSKDAHNMEALNMASLQGSVVRSYIRTHYRLPGELFTFQIDTLGSENNRTGVELLPQPAPDSLSVIHYSLNRTPNEVRKAMLRYRRTPYVGRAESTEGPKPAAKAGGEIADAKLSAENSQRIDSLNQLTGQLNRRINYQQFQLDSIRHSDSVFLYQSAPQFCKASRTPFLALKTDAIYWAGFTPEMKWKQALPNLTVEFYPGRHWSLSINGAYTNSLTNGDYPKRYAFSIFGAEGRYWLRGNRQFDGFFAGVYVNGGEFDVTPKHIDDTGHTGAYVGAGLSIGYTYMFSRWFGLELGIRGCFRHVSYDTYFHVPTDYYYESTKYKNGISLDGAFLNLIFRFEKAKNRP